jgi:hypothetical protein
VCTLCSAIKHPPTVVWRHLHSAGFIVCNSCLVSHERSPSQKTERVGMAIELRQVVQSTKHRTWWYFLTGDESRFSYAIDHDCMCIPGGEQVPTRPRRAIASPSWMLTVCWSRLGFSFVEILPRRIHFDFQYFCSNILSVIRQNRLSETLEDRSRRMVLHVDNVTHHTAKCMID